jgi:glycosyltransferase involved in cell wall biosynthesis
MAPKIAYLMSRFPHLPETFILREMEELQRIGWEIALYPLILQKQAVIHPEAQPWVSRARRVELLSWGTLSANGRAALLDPRRTASLWAQVVAENLRSPNFLARAAYLFPKAIRMARLMQQEGVCHIHAHYATHPALAAWLVYRLTGIRYSITVHAHDIFVRTAMLATKLREAVFIAAISEYNREHLARLVGPWVRDKIHIIHCGIRPEVYRPRSQPEKSNGHFKIIHVGSLQPYKGQQYLIRACAELRRREIPLHCRIIGGGAERSRLEALIKEHHLEGCVELMGPRTQQEVAQLLPEADCYVQPSVITPSGKMEGIPVALMEAMASAVPCVSSRLSGVPELVRDGVTGWLVPPADAPALAGRLAAIYADPGQAGQVAQAGRRLVLEEFELSSNVQKLAGLFQSLTNTTRC